MFHSEPVYRGKQFCLNVKFALPAEEKDGEVKVAKINVVPCLW